MKKLFELCKTSLSLKQGITTVPHVVLPNRELVHQEYSMPLVLEKNQHWPSCNSFNNAFKPIQIALHLSLPVIFLRSAI